MGAQVSRQFYLHLQIRSCYIEESLTTHGSKSKNAILQNRQFSRRTVLAKSNTLLHVAKRQKAAKVTTLSLIALIIRLLFLLERT